MFFFLQPLQDPPRLSIYSAPCPFSCSLFRKLTRKQQQKQIRIKIKQRKSTRNTHYTHTLHKIRNYDT